MVLKKVFEEIAWERKTPEWTDTDCYSPISCNDDYDQLIGCNEFLTRKRMKYQKYKLKEN